LQKILKEKKDFQQLEDFNFKGEGEGDSDYQKKYFENLNRGAPVKKKASVQKLSPTQIDAINKNWENNEMTSLIYDHIANDNYGELRELFKQSPELAHIRSEDGRGPMFWAHELGRKRIIKMLKILEVSETRSDASGKTPLELTKA
jgi:dolichyl-diphosphooligosaccharide---protein glycosyltransferase